MGGNQSKNYVTTAPTISWDEKNNRKIYKHLDPRVEYVFNFYGEYSRDEFLKAKVDDPELEEILKDKVEDEIASHKVFDYRSSSKNIYHKGRTYGFAYHNTAYMSPLVTMTLVHVDEQNQYIPQIRIERFLGEKNILIACREDPKKTIVWNPSSTLLTADYICELVKDTNINVVEVDVGHFQSIEVQTKQDLHEVITKWIAYMTNIQKINK
jgi:hypothetical protein